MNELIIAEKKINILLPVDKFDFLAMFNEIYYGIAAGNYEMASRYSQIKDELPTMSDFCEDEGMDDLLNRIASINYADDEEYFMRFVHHPYDPPSDELYEDYLGTLHVVECDMMHDVLEVVKAYNLSFRNHYKVMNYPMKGVW